MYEDESFRNWSFPENLKNGTEVPDGCRKCFQCYFAMALRNYYSSDNPRDSNYTGILSGRLANYLEGLSDPERARMKEFESFHLIAFSTPFLQCNKDIAPDAELGEFIMGQYLPIADIFLKN
jgi:hypothetical protein